MAEAQISHVKPAKVHLVVSDLPDHQMALADGGGFSLRLVYGVIWVPAAADELQLRLWCFRMRVWLDIEQPP
jgi:hypothetical protein